MIVDDWILALGLVTLVLGAFTTGAGFMYIKHLESRLAVYDRREAMINEIVDRRNEDNE